MRPTRGSGPPPPHPTLRPLPGRWPRRFRRSAPVNLASRPRSSREDARRAPKTCSGSVGSTGSRQCPPAPASKMGNSASPHGTGNPACAISVSRPTVFSATVLPPVFGPLMSSVRQAASSSQADRHHAFLLAPQDILEQRMPRILNQQAARIARTETRPDAVELCGKLRFGENQVQPPHGDERAAEWTRHSRAAAPSARAGCGAPRAALLR